MDDRAYIIDDLDSVYEMAMQAKSDSVFYKYVYDYIEVFDTYPLLLQVNKQIVDDARLKDQPLRELEETAIEEIYSAYQIVCEYIQDNKLSDENIERHLSRVVPVMKGDSWVSIGITKSMFSDLTYVLMLIVEDKNKSHLPFCRKYGEIDERGRIQNWAKLSPSYNAWEVQFETKKRIHELSDIYAWDQIVEFHNWYNDYEVEAQRLYENGKIWELGYVAEKFRVINAAISGKQLDHPSVIDVKREEFERYLNKVHKMVKRYLSTIIPNESRLIESNTCKVVSWFYDQALAKLTIGDKAIIFRRELMPAQILKVITTDEESRDKEWSWDELFEVIDAPIGFDKYPPKDLARARQKVSDAIDNIIERVAKRPISVNDFLEKDTYTVKINPNYQYKLS